MSSLSKEKYIEKYGIEEGIKRHQEFCKTRIVNEEKFIKLYGIEEGKRKWIELCNKRKFNNSLDGYIQKYGEIEGNKKRKEFCKNSTHSALVPQKVL